MNDDNYDWGSSAGGALELTTHSFVVTIWLEDVAGDAGQALWRGHVTHVLSGKRRYIQDLTSILDFIASYLDAGAPGR